MKKILSSLIFMCLMVLCSTVAFASGNTSFVSYGDATFIYMDTKSVSYNYDDDGEDIKFVADSKNILRLYNKKGTNDYLSFIPTDGNGGSGVGYAVREVHTKNPNMTFYEINANRGAHAMNCGYWLIGKVNGKWVTFVSLQSLASIGHTVNDWHTLDSDIDSNGRLILTSKHEYMPPGATYGYQKVRVTDMVAQIFWDDNAKWFGLKRLQ